MDKNKIKSFAIWARRNLIAAVSEKANRIGIAENSIEEAIVVQGGFQLKGKEEIFPLSKRDRDALVSQVKEKGFEQVMEEVAYTWFNRFMGLRYMEVNDYLPSGVRILSSEVEGKKEPDVLTKVSEIIDELDLNANEIYDLLDTGNTIDREKAYRIILVKQCNELGKIIPQMFEKISDYTELLLPDNLLEEGSVIRKMVKDIEESDWLEEVEIIGWMYQYYISEKKDEVFAALKKNVKITKENIPAATQLFTPKWIVKYMVENSLGRLWLEGHPNEELQKEWKYYLEEAEQEPDVEQELKKIREEYSQLKPEDIKVLDPCMGSGHILVYAFDVLYKIYKTAGYSEREIPRLILQNNLYGLDIDDRAVQLASFALIMKARHYNRRLFREIEREHLELNLCSIQESNSISKEAIDYFCGFKKGLDNDNLKVDIGYLCSSFKDAKEYGSILEVEKVNFDAFKQMLKEIEDDDNLMFSDYRKTILDKLSIIIKQAEIMSRKYEICITNPPYMGNNGMGAKLSDYIKARYPDSKGDLFAVFIERVNKILGKNYYQAMITQHSWMFLSSYEKLRENVLLNDIVNMVHLGARAFDEISGAIVQTTAFVMKKKSVLDYKGKYISVINEDGEKKKEESFLMNDKTYEIKKSSFNSIPGKTIAYWNSDAIVNAYKVGKCIDKYVDTFQGIITGNNDKFLRLWTEVCSEKIPFHKKSMGNVNLEYEYWIPYNKGGEFRKWYGVQDYVVYWKNGPDDKTRGKKSFQEYYLREYVSWSYTVSNSIATRYYPSGFLWDVRGSGIMDKSDNLLYLQSLISSKIGFTFFRISNSTLSCQVENILQLPIIINKIHKRNIEEITRENIGISKREWDSFELSWDFKKHPLVKLSSKGENYKVEDAFRIWKTECEEAFEQLKYNEEELNRIFIDIYGLQDELTPEVENKDITIRKADRERDIKSFISYAVGCILGRYSIDVEGLIYAGEDFNDKWNLTDKKVRKIEKDDEGNIISDIWIDSIFMPDKDNIIPITEDEYFEDDMVSRFIGFVRTVYGNDTLEENLDFIADSIGRKTSETARQAIRRYFIKDFYKDHLKVYQKRPIYWMFESGKNDGFKCLVYMHRYNNQTVAKIRTDYLHTLQRKYEAEINRLQLVVDSQEYTAKDRTVAKKKIDKISKQIEECREYDQVVAYLANEKISIDLDDGIKVNYAKFQDIRVINSKDKEVNMNLLAKI